MHEGCASEGRFAQKAPHAAACAHRVPVSPSPLLEQGQRVLLQGRPSVRYDVLSLNLGITPALSTVPGAAEHTTPVKPISGCGCGALGQRMPMNVQSKCLAHTCQAAAPQPACAAEAHKPALTVMHLIAMGNPQSVTGWCRVSRRCWPGRCLQTCRCAWRWWGQEPLGWS